MKTGIAMIRAKMRLRVKTAVIIQTTIDMPKDQFSEFSLSRHKRQT